MGWRGLCHMLLFHSQVSPARTSPRLAQVLSHLYWRLRILNATWEEMAKCHLCYARDYQPQSKKLITVKGLIWFDVCKHRQVQNQGTHLLRHCKHYCFAVWLFKDQLEVSVLCLEANPGLEHSDAPSVHSSAGLHLVFVSTSEQLTFKLNVREKENRFDVAVIYQLLHKIVIALLN